MILLPLLNHARQSAPVPMQHHGPFFPNTAYYFLNKMDQHLHQTEFFFHGLLFFAKIVNAVVIDIPNSEHTCSILFFRSASMQKFTFTICAICYTSSIYYLLYVLQCKNQCFSLHYLYNNNFASISSKGITE